MRDACASTRECVFAFVSALMHHATRHATHKYPQDHRMRECDQCRRHFQPVNGKLAALVGMLRSMRHRAAPSTRAQCRAPVGYELLPSSGTASCQACELNTARLADVTITPLTAFFCCSQIGSLRYPSLEALVRVPSREHPQSDQRHWTGESWGGPRRHQALEDMGGCGRIEVTGSDTRTRCGA